MQDCAIMRNRILEYIAHYGAIWNLLAAIERQRLGIV
jgi:hypothetical protein